MSDDTNTPAAAADERWKENLSPEQFEVLRNKATEPPFSGKFLKNKASGMYVCAACGTPLFLSNTKFESGTGWPSFYDAIPGSVTFKKEFSHVVPRTEVLCSKCGGHLGHVFSDGPQPTGSRYCVNSLSLDFVKGK